MHVRAIYCVVALRIETVGAAYRSNTLTDLWLLGNLWLGRPATQADSAAGWLRGSLVERQSLAGELSLSCARPVVDG